MLGPQTLGDYGYLRSTKELNVGHLGYFEHPQLETVNTEGFRGLLDVWESRGILIESQRTLDFKGSGSGDCACNREDRSYDKTYPENPRLGGKLLTLLVCTKEGGDLECEALRTEGKLGSPDHGCQCGCRAVSRS